MKRGRGEKRRLWRVGGENKKDGWEMWGGLEERCGQFLWIKTHLLHSSLTTYALSISPLPIPPQSF